jgi:hypothetical protein
MMRSAAEMQETKTPDTGGDERAKDGD